MGKWTLIHQPITVWKRPTWAESSFKGQCTSSYSTSDCSTLWRPREWGVTGITALHSCLLSDACCLLSPDSYHLSPVCCHLSPVTCLLSPVFCHLSAVYCLLSPVCCHLSPVSCHLSPVTWQLYDVSCLLLTICCHLSAVTCLLSAFTWLKYVHLYSLLKCSFCLVCWVVQSELCMLKLSVCCEWLTLLRSAEVLIFQSAEAFSLLSLFCLLKLSVCWSFQSAEVFSLLWKMKSADLSRLLRA